MLPSYHMKLRLTEIEWLSRLCKLVPQYFLCKMLRKRLHSRFISSSYLRRKVPKNSRHSGNIEYIYAQVDPRQLPTDSDSASESVRGHDVPVDEEQYGNDMAMSINQQDYVYTIAKLFDEINICDSTQQKLYNLFKLIGRERVFLPPFKDFLKRLKQASSISHKKYIFCDICNVFSLENQRCECVCSFGQLIAFNLEETIMLATSFNQEYLSTSISIPCSRNGNFVGSIQYQNIWNDTDGENLLRLTLIYNIDDASFVKSARISSTPISFVIAELPEHRRYCKANVFMSGLWWGHVKAKYEDLWYQSITQEMNDQNTLTLRINLHGETVSCKVRIGAIVADSVAKPKLMNIMQYNGSYGCPYCKHPGQSMSTDRGGSTMCYPWPGYDFEKKDHDFYLSAGIRASQDRSAYMGVKGPCALSSFFTFPNNFPIDYMHCVLEGVFKTLLGKKPFNSQATVKKMDEIGNKVCLPHEFSRKFRSVADLVYWKASECRTFLFFLTPLLKNCVDSENFHLIMSLTVSLRLLIKKDICNHDISIADDLIKIFMTTYQEINGENTMRFNIHLLSHLSEQVKNMGSLSSTSSFVFEDNIFKIKKTMHGNRGQNSQMADRYLRSKAFLKNELNTPSRWPQYGSACTLSHVIGKPTKIDAVEQNIIKMLRARFGRFDLDKLSFYTRVKKNHTIYHSKKYNYIRSSASYYFHYNEKATFQKRYGEIQYFVLIPEIVTCCGHDKIFAVFLEYSHYSSQTVFTNVDKVKNVNLKSVPLLVKRSQLFHKIKRTDKNSIIQLHDIQGKAIVTPDATSSSIYYATAIDSMFEHD